MAMKLTAWREQFECGQISKREAIKTTDRSATCQQRKKPKANKQIKA